MAGALTLLAASSSCSSETFRTLNVSPVDDGGTADGGGPIVSSDGSVCSDTSADPNHCGACNHSCLGARCSNGRCQLQTLTKDPNLPSSLALDESRFFVGLQGGSGGVVECPLAGCALGTGLPLTNIIVGGVAVDKDAVYFAELQPLGKIFRSVKGTMGRSPVADGDLTSLLRMASDGLYIASDGSNAALPSVARFDTVTTVLAKTATPIRGMAFTDERVLWTEPADKVVRAARRDGKTPVDVPEVFLPATGASGPGARGIAVVGSHVFIAGHVEGSIVRCTFASPCANPESLAVGGEPSLLAGDEARQKLYWYDTATKAIRSCDAAQCASTSTELIVIPDVFDLAVGTDAVYFTVRTSTGGAYRVAK
jgi:hypothetical protein